MRKKLLSIALSAAMAAFLIPASAFAATQTITMEIAPEEPIVTESDEGPANYYISEELDKEQIEAAEADASESQTAQHWEELAGEDADKVLMSLDEINQVNMMALGESETNMYDIEQLGGEYDADELAKSLAGTNYDTDRDLYVDGDKVDREAYFGTLKTAINTTGYTGTCTPRYAVAVARTDVKPWPINGVCTWSDEDPAEEIDGAALDVNEPFVIKQVCTVNDVEFYWGYTTNSTGWVKAKHLAVCEDIDQWTDAWKVDAESKAFIT
ncbi:MAG: hypothetical protein KBS66_08310, partial [Eubacterium sp.]|nr:hypothetical protein [Candidatus Colimonas fimequi]